jgi:hypothetical protein
MTSADAKLPGAETSNRKHAHELVENEHQFNIWHSWFAVRMAISQAIQKGEVTEIVFREDDSIASVHFRGANDSPAGQSG